MTVALKAPKGTGWTASRLSALLALRQEIGTDTGAARAIGLSRNRTSFLLRRAKRLELSQNTPKVNHEYLPRH